MGYFQVTFPGPADNIERVRVRDFKLLVELGLAKKEGKARFVQYVWIGGM